MFRVILPSHVAGVLRWAHQTPCLLFCVTSPPSAGPVLPSLSAWCFCLLQGLLMFFYVAETHLSAKTQSGQPGFLFGLEAWQTDPVCLVGVGFHCPQLRHSWRSLAVWTLLLQHRAGVTALAGVRQATAKDKVCKLLAIPTMSDGRDVQESLWLYLQRMSSVLNQINDLLAWAFQSTVFYIGTSESFI